MSRSYQRFVRLVSATITLTLVLTTLLSIPASPAYASSTPPSTLFRAEFDAAPAGPLAGALNVETGQVVPQGGSVAVANTLLGRALALDGIEYIVYVEKPGPVELLVEKHGYDVRWFNPITGEYIKLKDFKGERFTGEPPDKSHDWVLHVSREGHKEGMLRSYKFESRPILMQELELSPQKILFEIVQPSGDLSLSKPAPFEAKIKRETRATRSVMWLWTGEVAADGQGYRVLGTGQKGTLQIPAGIAKNFPAALHLRLTAMNANGKVYVSDRVYQLSK